MRKLFLICLLVIFQLQAQRTVIHAGNLIDVIDGKVFPERTIFVQNGTITAIEKGFSNPSGKDIFVDLSDQTVLPGLFDMHVHLENSPSKNSYIKRFTLNEADVAYNAAVYARQTLMAGFTTVRDLGGTGVNTALRDAVNAGKVPGPCIYSCGKSIASTGGHADPTNGYRKALAGDPGPAEGVVNGPDDARKAVRQRYKNGADVIKITSTGGVLSLAADGSGPQFQMDELAAIVETANDYGMVTAAHAHGAEGMKRAVTAGINTIEHGTYMTNEIMELMIEKGTYYVPTITAGKAVEAYAKESGYYPDVVVPKALAVGPQIQSTFGKAYQKGVKIAFGTDAGVFPHGENAKEFVYMHEEGMPVMEALQSATIVPAGILGIDDKLGSIEIGKLADIIGVSGNPLENPSILQQVTFVMKEGEIVKK